MNKLCLRAAFFGALATAVGLWVADGISVAQVRSLAIPRQPSVGGAMAGNSAMMTMGNNWGAMMGMQPGMQGYMGAGYMMQPYGYMMQPYGFMNPGIWGSNQPFFVGGRTIDHKQWIGCVHSHYRVTFSDPNGRLGLPSSTAALMFSNAWSDAVAGKNWDWGGPPGSGLPMASVLSYTIALPNCTGSTTGSVSGGTNQYAQQSTYPAGIFGNSGGSGVFGTSTGGVFGTSSGGVFGTSNGGVFGAPTGGVFGTKTPVGISAGPAAGGGGTSGFLGDIPPMK